MFLKMFWHRTFSYHLNIIMKRRLCSQYLKKHWILSTSFYSNLTDISRENFMPLNSLIEFRSNEARRSLVFEVRPREMNDLHSLCRQFGDIKNAFSFQTPEKKDLCIIEFENEATLHKILKATQTPQTVELMWLPLLRFSKKSCNTRQHDDNSDTRQHDDNSDDSKDIQMESPEISEKYMLSDMQDCRSVSEQIEYLYDSQKMTEVGCRLRFIACRKVEWVLPPVFCNVAVRPFGSCITTFGNRKCDVDMSLSAEGRTDELLPNAEELTPVRNTDRFTLELLRSLLSHLPGAKRTIFIPATVPIVKCSDTSMNLDYDISLDNSAFLMSEIMYLMACADPRVRPLVFSVRWWAKLFNLTSKREPWRLFSNFQLTLFVLFFLMNAKPTPILPHLHSLRKRTDDDVQSPRGRDNNGVSAYHVDDIATVPVSNNAKTLEELLLDFFEFYRSFNFSSDAISLVTGGVMEKPIRKKPLYMENPLMRDLNVCKNVNFEEVEALQSRCDETMNVLRTDSDSADHLTATSWGLVALWKSQQRGSSNPYQRVAKFDAESFLSDQLQVRSNAGSPLKTMTLKKSPQVIRVPQMKKKKRKERPQYNF